MHLMPKMHTLKALMGEEMASDDSSHPNLQILLLERSRHLTTEPWLSLHFGAVAQWGALPFTPPQPAAPLLQSLAKSIWEGQVLLLYIFSILYGCGDLFLAWAVLFLPMIQLLMGQSVIFLEYVLKVLISMCSHAWHNCMVQLQIYRSRIGFCLY